jgi:hypothetical protein
MDYERVDQLLQALPRETASPGFTARVLARLDETEARATAARERPWRIFELPRLTLPAAVLAATLAVAASVYLQGGAVLRTSALRPVATAPGAASTSSASSTSSSLGALASRGVPAFHVLPAAATATVGRRAGSLSSARALLAEIAQIRAEHGRLHNELRRLGESRASTVYLGDDESMDLVVHLDHVREQPDRPADPPPYQYYD